MPDETWTRGARTTRSAHLRAACGGTCSRARTRPSPSPWRKLSGSALPNFLERAYFTLEQVPSPSVTFEILQDSRKSSDTNDAEIPRVSIFFFFSFAGKNIILIADSICYFSFLGEPPYILHRYVFTLARRVLLHRDLLACRRIKRRRLPHVVRWL